LAFFLCIGATGSPVPCKSLTQVHAAFEPDAAEAGLQDSAAPAYPGATTISGSDIVFTISAFHRQFAYAHLLESHLTGSGPAVAASLTTIALNDGSRQWFDGSS
jgi:hypothetical protein